MTIRTTKRTVRFEHSFILSGFDEVLPPGEYNIETDEELLDGISFPAYRRITTLIHLGAKPGQPGIERVWAVDPKVLDAALMRDQTMAAEPADATSDVSAELEPNKGSK